MSVQGPDPFAGPYSYDFGMDAYGHAPNGWGRCEFINGPGGVCPPTKAAQTTWLMNRDLAFLTNFAQVLGITLPAIPLVSVLVPLIVGVLYP